MLQYCIHHLTFLFQIWVQCPHNASGYYTIYGDDSSYQDHFSARLVTGNTGEVYARTGYLGFLRRTEAIGSDGGKLIFLYFEYFYFSFFGLTIIVLSEYKQKEIKPYTIYFTTYRFTAS